jgi:NRAMP (natural resistance-associated macrophage protein)-like metal ion transporter
MNLLEKIIYHSRRFFKSIRLFLIILGPGIIVMVADNDAGGITTYAVTGAQTGYGLLWFMLVLFPVAYFVQEMTVRLGAVTKHGHAEAIFSAFGPFWGWFSLIDLALVNFLTLITEFIGMTAALSIFGISPVITIIIVVCIMGVMILSGKYWTWEKIALGFCLVNLIYIPCAFMVHPSVAQVLKAGFIPHFPGGFNNELFFLLMANIGTTIAPWMIFFQQSAIVDKGVQEKDIKWSRIDTLTGSALTVIVAIFIIIVTGTVLFGQNIESAAQASTVLMGVNKYVGTFVAIGLFDAGLLGAICISLATSWAFGEVFGWAHSLNKKVKEAPWFYAAYFILLIGAGVIVLIPNAPLVLITLFVQVVAVTLLPAALVFLILLLNQEKLMGKFKNTLTENIINFAIVILIIVTSTLYGISTIFPNLFK